jgi:hypothetical protein
MRRATTRWVDPWLHAAGYERIEALDEIDC